MSSNDQTAHSNTADENEQPLRAYDEFSAAHIETPASEESAFISRRGFLGAVSATMALVGAEGCRRPIEKIFPYGKMPEEVIPGRPSRYATSIVRGGEVVGLLVESHEGRPTKIEGNPAHHASNGKTDLITQATILDLYDPDRSRSPRHDKQDASSADFAAALAAQLTQAEKDGGAGLALLMSPLTSPTGLRLREQIAKRFPKARLTVYSSVNDSAAHEGAKLSFGEATSVRTNYEALRTVLSLDSDFLQTESGNTLAARQFALARARLGMRGKEPPMLRLYAVESTRTLTGSNADHRLRLPASQIEGYALALAAQLSKAGLDFGDLAPVLAKQTTPPGIPEKWIQAVAKDLIGPPQFKGHSAVVVGANQPALVHAIANAINHALGSAEVAQGYPALTDPSDIDHLSSLRALTDAMAAGQVKALVIVGGNPVYDAPSDLGFADKLRTKVPFSAHLALFDDETSGACTWHVARSHELEAWGDHRSLDGGLSIQQPLIAPLFDSTSDLELLALIAGVKRSVYDLVRETETDRYFASKHLTACGEPDEGKYACKDAAGTPSILRVAEVEHEWRRVLRDGIVVGGKPAPAKPPAPIRWSDLASAIEARKPAAPPSASSLEVTFRPDAKLFDGRYANNTWLQELPDPVTKIVWDNAAYLSPSTAKALGVSKGDVVKLTHGGETITAYAWVLPGQPDNTVGVTLGWGRTRAGRIAHFNDVARGFDVSPIRTSGAFWFASGVSLAKTGEKYKLAQTQDYESQIDFMGQHRPLAREAIYEDFRAHNDFPELQAPPPKNKLPIWTDQDYMSPNAGPDHKHQWGMSIDLNLCTGCSACVIACQSENNVPVVGPMEVARGREMSWIRLDRYYVENEHFGVTEDDPWSIHQPVACVHCEDAPCENVCPVNATTHSPEGLNDMAYNRCVGTRYCANNCPYKVRRFNFLNWHNDSVWKETSGLPETLKMQQNPNVTVRFRGTMEKCSYCVQRIQSAKISAKRELRADLEPNEVVSACMQACPSDAIIFGDLKNRRSRVAAAANDPRNYRLLEELGTKPRTFYLGKVRNPNSEMA